jgi:hypothetical protein
VFRRSCVGEKSAELRDGKFGRRRDWKTSIVGKRVLDDLNVVVVVVVVVAVVAAGGQIDSPPFPARRCLRNVDHHDLRRRVVLERVDLVSESGKDALSARRPLSNNIVDVLAKGEELDRVDSLSSQLLQLKRYSNIERAEPGGKEGSSERIEPRSAA